MGEAVKKEGAGKVGRTPGGDAAHGVTQQRDEGCRTIFFTTGCVGSGKSALILVSKTPESLPQVYWDQRVRNYVPIPERVEGGSPPQLVF